MWFTRIEETNLKFFNDNQIIKLRNDGKSLWWSMGVLLLNLFCSMHFFLFCFCKSLMHLMEKLVIYHENDKNVSYSGSDNKTSSSCSNKCKRIHPAPSFPTYIFFCESPPTSNLISCRRSAVRPRGSKQSHWSSGRDQWPTDPTRLDWKR